MAIAAYSRASGAEDVRSYPPRGKLLYYTNMAEEAAKTITGSREQWTSFLRTAGRLYNDVCCKGWI